MTADSRLKCCNDSCTYENLFAHNCTNIWGISNYAWFPLAL